MKPVLLSLITSIILPFLADAMPTAEEIAAAEPLVQEVMKAEMDALRSGKKTREQVGDAAVALAKAAQAPAEKYILLTGAFDYYMRGGAYDKAASALDGRVRAHRQGDARGRVRKGRTRPRTLRGAEGAPAVCIAAKEGARTGEGEAVR